MGQPGYSGPHKAYHDERDFAYRVLRRELRWPADVGGPISATLLRPLGNHSRVLYDLSAALALAAVYPREGEQAS
jgi:hypothetical protein